MKRLAFDAGLENSFLDKIKPDLIFPLQNTVPKYCGAYKILYAHQPIPFQTVKKFSFLKKEEQKEAIIQYLLGAFIKKSINRSDEIIVQTKWMKKAVLSRIVVCIVCILSKYIVSNIVIRLALVTAISILFYLVIQRVIGNHCVDFILKRRS